MRPRHMFRRHRRRCLSGGHHRFRLGRRNVTTVGEEPTGDRRAFRSWRITPVRRRPRRASGHLRKSRRGRRQDEDEQARRSDARQWAFLGSHVTSLIANYGATMPGRFEPSRNESPVPNFQDVRGDCWPMACVCVIRPHIAGVGRRPRMYRRLRFQSRSTRPPALLWIFTRSGKRGGCKTPTRLATLNHCLS